MADFQKRLVHLHSCRGMNWKLLHRIITQDKSLTHIYDLPLSELQQTFRLTPEKSRQLYQDLHRHSPHHIWTYYEQRNIYPLTIADSLYPSLLKQIYDPPFVLYAIGLKEILATEKRISIVGTRHPTKHGSSILTHLIPPLIQENWTIVSGLAKGIDALAHKTAIQKQGKTVAVLGAGFDYIYPKENKELFAKMSKSQLILSEYPPYTPPRRWQFPERNRIISGLSPAVLVVEAKERSGSLITADQALEQGRDVFAVPGSIFSEQSIGTNKLIQQGAKLVLNAEDILHESSSIFLNES